MSTLAAAHMNSCFLKGGKAELMAELEGDMHTYHEDKGDEDDARRASWGI